jgi:hypothetical protein
MAHVSILGTGDTDKRLADQLAGKVVVDTTFAATQAAGEKVSWTGGFGIVA